MADRSRIIEGRWRCTSCDTKDIAARFKNCPSCNNPREEGGESKFDFGAQKANGGLEAEGISDADAVAAARAGADWLCEYCQTANGARLTACRQCGAAATDKRLAQRAISGEGEGDGDGEGGPPGPPPPPEPPKKKSRTAGTVAGAVLLGLVGVCAWGMRTQEMPAEQVGTHWQRLIHQEEFVPVVKEGWQDELRVTRAVMPVNGRGELAGVENVRDCRRTQRGTRKVADGTERVCSNKSRRVQCGTEEKCSTKDLGNGYAEEVCRDVPKYCNEEYESCEDRTRYREEPVYGQKCRYDTYEWKRVNTLRAAGKDALPKWPQAPESPKGRAVREELYEVLFSYSNGGKTELHKQEPKTEAEFLRWANLRQGVIKVNNFGQVEELRPKE